MLADDLEFGSISLITFGLTSVDTIRKKSIRKNIISFSDSVATSASSFLRILYLDIVKVFKC
jgi:hypothetical protein